METKVKKCYSAVTNSTERIIWSILNFPSIKLLKIISSSEFQYCYIKGLSFRIEVILYAIEKSEICICINFYYRTYPIYPEIYVTVSFIDVNGVKHYSQIKSCDKTECISMGVVLDELMSDRFLLNNTIQVCCELTIFNTKFVKSPDISPSRLKEDFSALFNNSKLADVIIQVEDKVFFGHKTILSARSQIFDKMLESPMKESTDNKIVIEGFSADVIEEMLRYIYTDEVSDISKLATELITAADQYGLDRLKTICESEMLRTLTIENAADVYLKAILHNNEQLKLRAIDFINANALQVAKTAGWQNMSPDNLAELFTFNHKL